MLRKDDEQPSKVMLQFESSGITNKMKGGNGSTILRNPILTKICLQFLEDNYTYNIFIGHKIIGTIKYVNDKSKQ
jgi:hypothetical protein